MARCLQTWRLGGQYSLFECRLTTAEAQELFLQLIDADTLLLAWMDNTRPSPPITRCACIGFKAPTLYLG